MSGFIDITGRKFGRLTALRRVANSPGTRTRPSGYVQYECLCDCGNMSVVYASALVNGHIRSCGCLKSERASEVRLKDLTGMRFGRLTVTRLLSTRSNDGGATFECLCDCGRVITTTGHNLTSGDTRSCGCLKRDLAVARYTKYKTPEEKAVYSSFKRMHSRCCNKNNPDYPEWGGRGIFICDEWLSDPMKFVEWSKTHGYAPGLSIDRIDNNGPYSPENCRWATNQQQQNNKRSNLVLEIGSLRKTVAEWTRETGLAYEYARKLFHSDPERLKTIVSENLKQLNK